MHVDNKRGTLIYGTMLQGRLINKTNRPGVAFVNEVLICCKPQEEMSAHLDNELLTIDIRF